MSYDFIKALRIYLISDRAYPFFFGSAFFSLFVDFRRNTIQCDTILAHDSDKAVVDAMRAWGELTDKALAAMKARDYAELARLTDENFDMRAKLYKLSDGNLRMVQAAREAGASAKFSGSGGAIVGVCPDDETFARLQASLSKLGVVTLRPALV